MTETLLWDRKAEGGFPETKELKNRVRNIIEPDRDLGHIDRSLKKGQGQAQQADTGSMQSEKGKVTEANPAVHSLGKGEGEGQAKEQVNSGINTKCEDCT